MSTYDIIKKLCDSKGIATTALEKDLGFGRGSIGKLRKGTTSAERLQKIADYFDVSLEYLMTGKQESYYINEETARLAQEVFERPDLRVLFDMSRTAKPEDVQIAIQILQRLRETENG